MKIASNRTLCDRLTHQKKKQIKIEPQGEKKFLSYATKRASFSSRPMQAFVSWDLHESVQGHASLIIILKKAVNKEWSYLKLVSLAQEKKDSLPFNNFRPNPVSRETWTNRPYIFLRTGRSSLPIHLQRSQIKGENFIRNPGHCCLEVTQEQSSSKLHHMPDKSSKALYDSAKKQRNTKSSSCRKIY